MTRPALLSRALTPRWRGRLLALAALTFASAAVGLGVATARSVNDAPRSLPAVAGVGAKPQLTYADGSPMTVTYANEFNLTQAVALHDMPPLLVQAFIAAEDRRFFEHDGVDWLARAHAAVQNVLALRTIRGASTITEQVVRMLRPRPRTLWSRWVEGFEAMRLERRFGKAAVLEFYLNQVPYASNRRGVAQAAHSYFGRSLDTLSDKEMLALSVLVRAPSALDLHRDARAGRLSHRAGR